MDTINDSTGNDKIVFGEGISRNSLIFRQVGNDLHIYVDENTTQGIIIKSFYSSTIYKIEKIEFADGSSLNIATTGLTLTQTNAGETINGTVYADTIYGSDGKDAINAGNGHDTIIGGRGNDILNGSRGNDSYKWNLGDGMDTLSDNQGTDKIIFGTGIQQNDLRFVQEGNNLRIVVDNDFSQGILINSFFNGTANKIETIEFADNSTLDITQGLTLTQTNGDETITGTAYDDNIYAGDGFDIINAGDGNDIIQGGQGIDSLNGGNGNDTYVWNLGDDFDTISENGGNDIIQFGSGINSNNLTLTQNGNDLRILVNNNISQGMDIKNYFSSDNNKVENIKFADGSSFSIDSSLQLVQAMSSFGNTNSANSNDNLADITQSVSDMYDLACNGDLNK